MNIINSFGRFFSWNVTLATPQLDPTKYLITTNSHEYIGIIIQQDNFLIKFQCQNNKTVKILKSNINQMAVVLDGMENVVTAKKRFSK